MSNTVTTKVWKTGNPFVFPKWYFDRLTLYGSATTNITKTFETDLASWDALSDEALYNFEDMVETNLSHWRLGK